MEGLFGRYIVRCGCLHNKNKPEAEHGIWPRVMNFKCRLASWAMQLRKKLLLKIACNY